MYLAIIILPLLGSIVSGFFLLPAIDFSDYTNLLTWFTLLIIAITHELEGLTELSNFNWDYAHSIPFSETESDTLFDLQLDTGIHLLEEKTVLVDGVADSNGARARDSAILNGLDTNVSYQPYARDLADKLERDRDGSSNIPSSILPRDQDFIRSVAPNCWGNYNPNVHYLNSRVMRSYLRSLR